MFFQLDFSCLKSTTENQLKSNFGKHNIAKQYGLDCVTRACTFQIGALTNTECVNTHFSITLIM